MVQGLHASGLGVVMDVVFNHTNASGLSDRSVFDKIVPGYYHRLNEKAEVERSTCCENTASEHVMMEKLIIDNLLMWTREYRVDGYRFDLMGHHMVSNMLAVRKALDALTQAKDGVDGKNVILYGEGWNFGEVANGLRGVNAIQSNLAGTGIGSFNDRLRDAIRGGSPFADPRTAGFATGLYYSANSDANEATDLQQLRLFLAQDFIRLGMAGTLKDYEFETMTGVKRGDQIQYNGSPAGYALNPQETVNYAAAHDNETLFDKVQWSMAANASMAQRVRANNLANAVIALSQGMAFFHAGDDILRSKSLDRDSYNSSDWLNAIDWTYETTNWGRGLPPSSRDRWDAARPILANPKLAPGKADVMLARDVFKEFLQIRKSSKLFRLSSGEEIKRRVSFPGAGRNQQPGMVAMLIDGNDGPDYKRVLVVLNSAPTKASFTDAALKDQKFTLHPVQQRSVDALTKDARYVAATGTFEVPPQSAVVFVIE
jgi:pullulanase-type alpha-1,6-glucosidase